MKGGYRASRCVTVSYAGMFHHAAHQGEMKPGRRQGGRVATPLFDGFAAKLRDVPADPFFATLQANQEFLSELGARP